MTAWMLANPIASALLAAFAGLTLLTLVRIAWSRITIAHGEREAEQDGDIIINVFETKRVKRPYPGDGVEAGV